MAQLKGGTTIAGSEAWHAGNLDGTSIVPSGVITMWAGTITAIPASWFLCDGLNGTPDLRGRFVYGASVDADVNVVGGSANAIVVSHSHTTPNHTHTTPNHIHSASSNTTGNHHHDSGMTPDNINGSKQPAYVAADDAGIYYTGYAGDHSHTITVNSGGGGTTGGASPSTYASGSSGTNANLPPYMKLAYIQKA